MLLIISPCSTLVILYHGLKTVLPYDQQQPSRKNSDFPRETIATSTLRLSSDRIFSMSSFLETFSLFWPNSLCQDSWNFHLLTNFRIDLPLLGWFSSTHFQKIPFCGIFMSQNFGELRQRVPYFAEKQDIFQLLPSWDFSKLLFYNQILLEVCPNHPSMIPPVFFKTISTCFEFHISKSFIGVVFFKIVFLHYLWYN